MIWMNIFKSEIKYQLKSIVFWVLAIAVLGFVFSQFTEEYVKFPGDQASGIEGQANSASYGVTHNLSSEEEIQLIRRHLWKDLFQKEGFTRYGLIIKDIRVDEVQKKAMAQLIDKIDNHSSYQEFVVEVNKLDTVLGGNTIYGDKFRPMLSRKLTYEEAVENFENRVEEGMTNVYGRLFADYLGLTAGLFPVFIGAFLLGRDRRWRMDDLIKIRGIRSLVYVSAKYLAVVLLLVGVYLIISLIPTVKFYFLSKANGWPFHPLGFLKYTVAWVLPTVLFTIACGMTIAELVGSGLIAVAAQIVFTFSNSLPLKGNYSLSRFIIRFNTIEGHDILVKSHDAILLNRLFYLLLSGLLVVLCAWVWEKKEAQGRR